MSIKKIKTILLSVAAALIVLAYVLFIVTPLIGNVNVSAMDVLVKGMAEPFKFDFSNGISIVILGFMAICILLIIWWAILLGVSKRGKEILWVIPIFVLDVLVMFLASSLFLVPEALNGKEFFTGILMVENGTFATALVALSVLFMFVSVLFAAVFMFFDYTVTSVGFKPDVVYKTREETDDEYYERMIREMDMFHEGEEEAPAEEAKNEEAPAKSAEEQK